MVLNKTWQHIVDPLPERTSGWFHWKNSCQLSVCFFCIKEHWLIHDHFQHIFMKSEDLSPDVAALSVNLSTDPTRPGVGVGLTSLRGGSKRCRFIRTSPTQRPSQREVWTLGTSWNLHGLRDSGS